MELKEKSVRRLYNTSFISMMKCSLIAPHLALIFAILHFYEQYEKYQQKTTQSSFPNLRRPRFHVSDESYH